MWVPKPRQNEGRVEQGHMALGLGFGGVPKLLMPRAYLMAASRDYLVGPHAHAHAHTNAHATRTHTHTHGPPPLTPSRCRVEPDAKAPRHPPHRRPPKRRPRRIELILLLEAARPMLCSMAWSLVKERNDRATAATSSP